MTLPLVASRVAVAVQLQIPRVFWMADLLATLGVVWWLAERGRRAGDAPAATSRVRRPALVFAALTLFALGRGGYVLYVEHPGRPLVSTHMPQDDWADVAAYLRRDTPPATHVLADPNHAWRFGTSLRVAAARDVFLENVKDEAMSMYDRPMALRVAERQAALGAFEDRTAADLQALARRYGLDVVVAERDLGAARAVSQPPVPRLSPHPVTTTSTLPSGTTAATTPERFAPAAAYVPHPRWTGGHWMTIYTWARRRRFAGLPEPGGALLRRRP